MDMNHTPYQIRVETSNGPRVDYYRTAAAARAEVDAINGTRSTRKHGMAAAYIGHIERAGDEWARIVSGARVSCAPSQESAALAK